MNLERTLLPFTLAGVHLGIASTHRSASSVSEACGERSTLASEMEPSLLITN